ncbi:MAG: helix-turn-helix domain-containing protein [Candidatus Promineofilum sp.]|mgnify:CR=1 FL=1|nr:helix-turn-helix domain-containing protein [Promineifilum sp.]MCW5861955.1 helix-turn-helix domain-containing protein [Anaerolineae bacterium]
MDKNHDSESDINVGDLLRLALPLDTRLVGNNAEPRHYVNWVAALVDWANVEEQVQPNDLALIPATLQRQLADAGASDLLRPLADLPVAALLFFDPIGAELEAALNTLRLTALLAPPKSSLRDIHESVALLLVDRQKATSERALQLYRQLSTMSREGLGLQAMTEIMSNLTGNTVAVQDKRLEVNAISWSSTLTPELREAVVAALEQREGLPPVLRNRKAAAKARQSVWQMVLPIENLGRLISPIISGDRARGYLSVIGPAAELDMFDSLTVEHGAAACALEMAKAKAVSEAKKALRGDFLEGLLAGTMPAKEIERLEGRLDHNTREPHAVMVFGWLTPDISLRRLETSVHWVLSNHPRPALAHIYGNQHLVVFQALKNAEDMESAHQLGRRIHEQIEAEFPGAQLIGGISGPARALTDWPASYDQALQAMQLGQRLKLTNQFVQFSSLGIYRLLYGLENLPEVRRFAEDIMRPLAEYDEQNRGSLVKTVEAYFSHHGNISQTAESLFVHRNTLLYRMERIQELTGLQLDQANMRLALHLALRLWQLRPENESDAGQL